MRRLPPLPSLALALAACGPASAPPPTSSATGAATPAPAPANRATPPDETTVAAEEPPAADEPAAPMRLAFDLAAHPARATLRRAEGRWRAVDLGLAGARLSFGGWRSGFRGASVEGVPVLASRGRQGRLTFRARGDERELRLEGRLAAGSRAQVYVNDRHLGAIELPREAFGEARIALPADTLRAGENELLLRSAASRGVPGVGRAGVLLRTLWIGGDGGAAPGAPPAIAAQVGEHAALRLPAGWSAGFPLVVPPGARLRAVLRSGQLRVRALRDGADPLELGAFDAEEPTALDLDLGTLAEDFAELELQASADAELLRPAVVVPTGAGETAEADGPPRPRNALLVLVDTLRADKLAPYNAETRVQTPGLAAFAETASTLLGAHAQENWTKPSVATLLSSLMPWEHTATQHSSVLPRSVELLPEVLKERGFHTGAFICNGFVSDRFGFEQGWDTYRNYIREGRRTHAESVAADVLAWLDARPEEKPFFLYVHTIDPHVPYRPPRDFLAMYGDPDYRGPVDFRRDATLLENVKLGRVRLGEGDRAHLEALYDGEISYHDRHFQAILDGLDRRGLAEDTAVILTSDHGEEFWDHGSVGHGHSVWEELLHVPLLVRLPGRPAKRITSPVGLVDVMPTLLDALGVEAPDGLSGRSFLGELDGADVAEPRVTVSGFMEHWRTIVVGRWKLVQRPRRAPQLYDLVRDPDEERDVAEARPRTVAFLRGLLGLRLAETGGWDEDAQDAAQDAPRRRPARRHRAEQTEIDDETAAQLRALGYLGD
ncbi:MAG: hypothetical protein CMN29_04340 [Sandaracinus sp.]|nr:hypothetical protein [Sandaracinus sp.]